MHISNKAIKHLFFYILFAASLVSHFSFAQNVPAAERNTVSIEESVPEERAEANVKPEKKRVFYSGKKQFKKRILKKFKSKKGKRRGLMAGAIWFIVLLVLGLLSLITFIWIGWWCMLICGLLFLGAFLALAIGTESIPTPRNPFAGVALGIFLGVFFGVMIVIALVALLIWGIVALILAIIN